MFPKCAPGLGAGRGAGRRGGATSLQECLSWNQSGREPSGSAGRVVGPGGTLVSVGGQVGECRRHKASFSFCCFLLFTVYIGFKRLCASRFKRPYTLYEHAHIPPPPPPPRNHYSSQTHDSRCRSEVWWWPQLPKPVRDCCPQHRESSEPKNVTSLEHNPSLLS